jgi:hypothetical protein
MPVPVARPLLNPALRLAWRDERTLQIGADPQRAVVLTGVDVPVAAAIERLDGTRTWQQALSAAADGGLAPATAERLLHLLAELHLLVDASRRPTTGLAPVESRRLAAHLASWSVQPEGEAPPPSVAARRAAVVAVDGAGRVGATLVGLLAAAGVGEVVVRDRSRVGEHDLSPGGHHAGWVDRPRAQSALTTARSCAPWLGGRETRRGRERPRPSLVVLCPDAPEVAVGVAERFLASGIAHVVGATYERVGVVGPLVRPGSTPCLRCLELHRRDRDPAWPLVAGQLAGRPDRVSRGSLAPACDVVLAAQVAAALATAVLGHLDDPAGPHELVGSRLELRPPSNQPRRRRWSAHPSCGCGWPGYATRPGRSPA